MNDALQTPTHRPSSDFGAVLSAPFLPYDVDLAPVAGTDFPWPVHSYAFRFATFDDFCGVYLAPSHWVSKEYRSVDLRVPSPPGLEQRAFTVSGLEDGEALYRVLMWGSVPGPDGQRLAPSLAWLTRVMAVVHWVACPHVMASEGQGALPLTGARVGARVIVCPGSNFHVLLLLAWRAIRDSARVLSDALVGAKDVDPGLDSRYPQSIRDAVAGLGPVPVYPLAGWSDVASVSELGAADRYFIWGARSVGGRAALVASRIGSMFSRINSPNAHRMFRFEAFNTVDKRLNWDRTLGHNVVAYSVLCARFLGETVVALRILAHIVHQVRMVYLYRSESQVYRPTRWAASLDSLASVDLGAVDRFFPAAREASSIPYSWLWVWERELEGVVARAAPFALQEVWGIPFNQADSLDRAGASCPDNGRYFAPRAVPSV